MHEISPVAQPSQQPCAWAWRRPLPSAAVRVSSCSTSHNAQPLISHASPLQGRSSNRQLIGRFLCCVIAGLFALAATTGKAFERTVAGRQITQTSGDAEPYNLIPETRG